VHGRRPQARSESEGKAVHAPRRGALYHTKRSLTCDGGGKATLENNTLPFFRTEVETRFLFERRQCNCSKEGKTSAKLYRVKIMIAVCTQKPAAARRES